MQIDYVLLVAALLPAVILLIYIYRKDRIEKEPLSLLLRLFAFGAISCIPAVLLEMVAQKLIDSFFVPSTLVYHIVTAFLGVALIEEGMKFFFLKLTTWRSFDFNYRFDGIVYAVFVSLGFAALENIFYVFFYGLDVAFVRSVLAVPAHMGFAVYMGALYGQARLQALRGKRHKANTTLVTAWFVATILHGFYDACLFIESPFASAVFLVFVVVMYIVTIGVIRKHSRNDFNMYI